MVELVKQSMADIWASAGDIVMPDPSKIATGWAVEVVPRQYWNWMQNRVDNNIAYLLQHGIPEWDATTEYIVNKSYVQHGGIVYKAILTGTNKNPSSEPTYWGFAFVNSSVALEALKGLTPAADKLPYFTGTTTAATTTLTGFARSILDDADAAAVRTTIGAQPLDATLTAVAGLTTAANKLPYFTGTDTVTTTDLSPFARTLLDDVDSATALVTIGAQPVDATLTAVAGVTTAADKLIYFTGVDAATSTTLSAFGRTLIDDADATAAKVTLGLNNVDNTSDANKPVSTATQTALNLKANLASPTFTGTPLTTTPSVGDNSTKIASTAYVVANAAIKDSDTGSVQIPAGTTGQRTGSPTYGRLRANSTLNSMEWWNGVVWSPVGSGAGATGAGVGLAQDQIFNETDVLVTDNWTIGQGSMQTGITITIASPAVFTFTGHSLTVGQPIRFTTTGALPTGLTVNAQYYVIATGLTANTFQISLTAGGAAVNTSGTQSGTHSFGKIKNALVTKELKVASGKSVTIPSGSSLIVVGSSGGSGVADQYVNTFSAQDIGGAKNFTVAPKLNGVDLTSIGINQTWQNMTGSRTSGTTYTNSTGKPIMVNVQSTGASTCSCVVSGVIVAIYSQTNNVETSSFIVPNGATYTLTGSWTAVAELR